MCGSLALLPRGSMNMDHSRIRYILQRGPHTMGVDQDPHSRLFYDGIQQIIKF